jgi:uncharacterized protein (TIGR03435 family)
MPTSIVLQSIAVLLSLAAVVGALAAPRLHAQSSPSVANSPAFEVASVKPAKSGGLPPVVQSPSRFTMRAPLRVLIQNAYQLLQEAQLVGGPSWLTSDRFDINATVAGNPPVEQIPLMLRALLADRFKLVVHTEKRELPIYALVLAGRDGKPGARIRPATFGCLATRGRANGSPPTPQESSERVRCTIRKRSGNVIGEGISFAQLADTLAPFVNRVVIDQTGVAGDFDFDLEWTPDQWKPDVPQQPQIIPDSPSLFTALQEQLGLKLESTRGLVDVLVIDSVSQPTPD